MVLSVLPFFMGDAINYYVLGRIKLEHENNWDDIRMTDEFKSHIGKYYKLYRAVSIITSYGLGLFMIFLLLHKPFLSDLILPLTIFCFIYFSISLRMIVKGIAPIIPSYKKKGLVYRILFVLIVPILWWYVLNHYSTENLTAFTVFTSGLLYFVACGMMHPLPANGSLLESILRDSIISQAKAVARARAEQNDKVIDFSRNNQDIEDASIVSEEGEASLKSEVRDQNVDITKDSEGIMPDAIIEDRFSYSDEDEINEIDESDAEIVSVKKANIEDKTNE